MFIRWNRSSSIFFLSALTFSIHVKYKLREHFKDPQEIELKVSPEKFQITGAENLLIG